jgi:hypothetical protein
MRCLSALVELPLPDGKTTMEFKEREAAGGTEEAEIVHITLLDDGWIEIETNKYGHSNFSLYPPNRIVRVVIAKGNEYR